MATDKPLNQVLCSGFSHEPKQNFRSSYLLSVKMINVAVVNVLSLEKELVSKMRLLFLGILCILTSVSVTPLRLSRGTFHSPNEDSCSQAKLPKTDLSGSLACFCVHLKCVLWVSVLCENTGSLADSHAWLIPVPDRILPAAAPQRWPSSEGVKYVPTSWTGGFPDTARPSRS